MKANKQIKKIRIIAYILLGLFIGYLTYILIITTKVEKFEIGEIDFSKNEINNYSVLIGALVGVLGVILLIETFWLQFKQYQDDKIEKIKDDRLDLINRLKLFTIDLITVKEDFVSKFDKIEVYYKAELKDPYTGHVLTRTSSGYFSRIHLIGRITLYRSFAMFVQEKSKDWIKNFNDIYKILDFLEDLYKNLYSIYESHAKEQVDRRMAIRSDLSDLMNESTHFLGSKERELGSYDLAIENKEWQLVNSLIGKFTNQLNIQETSYDKIRDLVLSVFISNVLNYRDEFGYLTHDLDRLIEKAANIKREIELHRDKAEQFASNLAINYEALAIAKNESKSVDQQLDELIEILKASSYQI